MKYKKIYAPYKSLHSEFKSIELDIENQFNTKMYYNTLIIITVICHRESHWSNNLVVLINKYKNIFPTNKYL